MATWRSLWHCERSDDDSLLHSRKSTSRGGAPRHHGRASLIIAAVILTAVLLFTFIALPLLVMNKLDRQRAMHRIALEDEVLVTIAAIFTNAIRDAMAAAYMLEGFVQSTLGPLRTTLLRLDAQQAMSATSNELQLPWQPSQSQPQTPSLLLSSMDNNNKVARALYHRLRHPTLQLQRIMGKIYERFEQVASLIALTQPSLAMQAISPNGTVRFVWPNDSAALNHNMFNTSDPLFAYPPLPVETRDSGVTGMLGPYHLPTPLMEKWWVISIRKPIFDINDPSQHSIDNFWGFSSTLLNLSDVIAKNSLENSFDDMQMDFLLFTYSKPNNAFTAIAATPWLLNTSVQQQLEFVRTAATGTPIFEGVNLTLAVRSQLLRPMLTSDRVFYIVCLSVLLAMLLFLAMLAWIERYTRVYDGRMYAPKLTPFAVLTIGPCYGEELWNLVPVQMAEVIDKLNHVLNKQMAVHHAYKVAQMQPYTTVFVLRTVEAAVRMSFDVIAELQRHPIDADLTTLLDADGQLLMAYAVHLCTDVGIVPSVTGDRSYRYEGADMVYGARMWAFSAPNTVTLSAAAQPHACAMRDGAGSKGGSDKCNKGSGDSSSNGSRSSRSTSSGNSGIHVSSYTTIFLRGVKGKQELYTVTDSTNKYLVHAIAQAQARVQRELCAQEQLAQQQHRVRARARLHSGDASYSSANASSMYVSSSTTLFGASLPGSHNMPASDASSGSRYDLGASVAEQDGRSASQSDVAHELPQQTSTTTMTAVAAATSLRRGASVTVPPCERLAVSPAYTHEQSSSGSGKVSNSATHNVTTVTATAAVVATVMPASPACNTTVSSSSSSSNAATAGVAGSGGGGGTVAHARPLVPPQLHLHTEGDNPLAADTTLASAASSHTVGAIRDNSGGGLLGSVATTVMRAATAAVGSTTKRNSGGAGGGTSGPLRIDVPVNPLMAPAASSTTPQRSVTNNMATTIAASAAAAAVAGGDGAHVDGAAVTVSASCGTASSVGGGGSSMGGGSGSSASAGMMHAASLHGSSAQRASLTGEPADNPLELGNAPPLPLHAPKMSDLSGVVMLSEKSDEHTPQHSSCPSQQHPHAAQLQQQLPMSHDEQQVHLLQHQPVSLNTISSNTLLNGFGPLQCTAPPATVAAAAVTTATASMRASNTVVSPEYGLRDANTYAWLHRAIPLWLDKALRRAFEHQSIALEVSYESVRVMVYYFYASYKLLFRPLAVPERDNIYRRLITAFGIPRKDILEHLAARCTIHYMQQHEHTKSLAWKMCAPTQI